MVTGSQLGSFLGVTCTTPSRVDILFGGPATLRALPGRGAEELYWGGAGGWSGGSFGFLVLAEAGGRNGISLCPRRRQPKSRHVT